MGVKGLLKTLNITRMDTKSSIDEVAGKKIAVVIRPPSRPSFRFFLHQMGRLGGVIQILLYGEKRLACFTGFKNVTENIKFNFINYICYCNYR